MCYSKQVFLKQRGQFKMVMGINTVYFLAEVFYICKGCMFVTLGCFIP